MRDRRHTALRQLRDAVGCLPRATRVAMLEGIDDNPIIVGAYADAAGICPMLAAHRAGGRTSFIGFATAWDAFAFRGSRRGRARQATQRELLVLRTYLEASLLDDDCPEQDLAVAAREHRALVARQSGTRERATQPGDPDRSRELGRRPGWRWMRVVRSLEDYEEVLRALEREAAEAGPDGRPRGQPASPPVASA